MAFLTGQNNGNFVAQGGQNLQNPYTAGQVQGNIGDQQNLINALGAQQGLVNQSQVYNQLQGVAQGIGPNPAQAMLNQATGQNVANQAALAAGQRGASANVGLLARQAGMQGANAQQQSIGQGASLQAQQSMGALGQAGALANNQVANQIGATQGLGNQLGSGLANQNTMNVQNAAQQNQSNAAIAASNNEAQQGLIGGLLQGVGTAASAAIKAPAAALAQGGLVENPKAAQVPSQDRYPSDLMLPSHLKDVAQLYHGGKFSPMKQGGVVPGQAKESGDHFSNDTVKAKLSPGEVVIPKSVMESDDPVKGAAEFVAALEKKKGSSDVKGDFKTALAAAIKNRKKK